MPAELPEVDNLQASARIGGRADLSEVRLVRVESQLVDWDAAGTLHVAVESQLHWFRAPDELAYTIEFDVGIHDDGDDGEPAFTAKLEFVLTYRVPDDFEATDDEYGAFGTVSVVFSSWPYLREALQTLTSRAGLPALVLGTLRSPVDPAPTPPKKKSAAKKPRATKAVARKNPKSAARRR